MTPYSSIYSGSNYNVYETKIGKKIPCLKRSYNFDQYCSSYHRVRKALATHIMLDHRTTTMAFIECTDLYATTTHYQWSRKLYIPLQKTLNRGYSNSLQQYRLFHHRD